jgi:hypothetical protein
MNNHININSNNMVSIALNSHNNSNMMSISLNNNNMRSISLNSHNNNMMSISLNSHSILLNSNGNSDNLMGDYLYLMSKNIMIVRV